MPPSRPRYSLDVTSGDRIRRNMSRIVAVVLILCAAWLAPGTVLFVAFGRWIFAVALGLVMVACLALAFRFARPRRNRDGE
jgi:CHASE2 domain-containing sensor protein